MELSDDYMKMLSLVWNAKSRPASSIPQSVVDANVFPWKYLGIIAALGLGERVVVPPASNDDDLLPENDRHHVPKGWAPLLGYDVEELYGYSMCLIFKLGRTSNLVRAWNWKDGGFSDFDSYVHEHYREADPVGELGSFEHFLWWRFGDPRLLLPQPSEPSYDGDNVEETLASIRSVRPWLQKLSADLSEHRVEAFEIGFAGDEPAKARLVEHVKFGRGQVVRELESDKLEILFDDGATKILQSRFVQPVGA